MTETRVCAGKCGRELPIEMFGDTEKKKFITCLECRAYKLAWRNNNKESANASNRKYYKNNRERLNEESIIRNKKNAERDREKRNAYQRKRRSKNKDKYNEYQKEYRKEHLEELQEGARNRYKENPEPALEMNKKYRNSPEGKAARLNSHTRRRAKIGEQKITGEEWLSVMEMNGWKCIYCGATLTKENRAIDHLIPLKLNGQHRIGNLVPCCNHCNSSKKDKPLKDWYIFQTLPEEKQNFLLEMETIELERMNNLKPNPD